MDRKFFFFRREQESETSASFSDTGVGLSTIAIPSENLTFITSGKKKVIFTFKDCNGFDETVLQEGESIPKATITVACKDGEESSLIESVINFMSRNTAKNIMKFDVVKGESTFKQAVVDTLDDVRSIIPSTPINTQTKEISVGDEAKKFQQTIAEITFSDELPFIDFNHEMLASGTSFTTKRNAGTHPINIEPFSGIGTPSISSSSDDNTLFKNAITMGSSKGLNLQSETFISSSDYTLYVAVNVRHGSSTFDYGMGGLYGDDAGECFGFGALPKEDGAISASNNKFITNRDVFAVRHAGINGLAAFSKTTSSSDGTKSFAVPGQFSELEDYDPNHVFIVRRDRDFNMFLHNRDGDIIAKIPAKTGALDSSLRASSPGRTDGDLTISTIGQSGGQPLGSKLYLYRFGVIQKDIGANDAANLAKQLHRVYGTK